MNNRKLLSHVLKNSFEDGWGARAYATVRIKTEKNIPCIPMYWIKDQYTYKKGVYVYIILKEKKKYAKQFIKELTTKLRDLDIRMKEENLEFTYKIFPRQIILQRTKEQNRALKNLHSATSNEERNKAYEEYSNVFQDTGSYTVEDECKMHDFIYNDNSWERHLEREKNWIKNKK